jgi:Na+-transporting methylmalonyl-CoA/oxaloacetate decarboxylase gamma subunit
MIEQILGGGVVLLFLFILWRLLRSLTRTITNVNLIEENQRETMAILEEIRDELKQLNKAEGSDK